MTRSLTNGVANGDAKPFAKPIARASRSPMPIAIIGMSCRFPGGATSPSKLWDLCINGRSAWSEIPETRFNVQSLYHPDRERPGRSNVTGAHFLDEDVSLFDAGFFSFSADVAAALDPQVRLLLEAVYEASENAGIPIEKLAGSNTSVYSGAYTKDFAELSMRDPETLPVSFVTGTGTAMLSNRISHFFDLQGPSLSVDTGCSSGLSALSLGVTSIRSGESSLSIVGASSVLLNPDMFITGSTQGLLSPDGKCYAWDSRAKGYGRGEGVAALVLKSLDAALHDGDNIEAIIREIRLNQDGKTTTITSPSAAAQEALIRECYERAGLDLSETAYVEAHMTGTPTGDPIEAEALARTFGKSREPGNPVIVGSVKTNIGHTEAVSGLAAVIKASLVLQNRMIPPNLNYVTTNPNIPLKDWNLMVPTSKMELPDNLPVRVSVNNFGYGGTNAHVILEASPKLRSPGHSRRQALTNGHTGQNQEKEEIPKIFCLSARDSGVVKTMRTQLASHIRQSIESGNPINMSDLAHTLHQRRSKLPWRMALTAKTPAGLAEQLENTSSKPVQTAKAPRLAFVFNGQGAQWHAMGRELINHYPIFGTAIREADSILKEYGANWSLCEELMRDEKSTRVHYTNISQPISVAIQLCLVDLLRSWGISPSAVTSHSSGEIAAAYAVGVLSFKEALAVVYFRGELALKHQKLASLDGAMLAAGLGLKRVEPYLADLKSGRVVVACVNSPNSVTLSGDSLAINEVEARLNGDGVFARKLKVPLAYHSHHMIHMAKEYTDSLTATLSKNRIWDDEVLYSSPVTGDIIASPKVLSPEHWVRNLTSPVLFSQSFEKMCFPERTSDDKSPRVPRVDLVVEIGAHSTLSGPIRQIMANQGSNITMPYTTCLKRNTHAVQTMQELACYLVCRGYPVDLSEVNFPQGQGKQNFIASLPSYPWNHSSSYWVESRINRENRFRKYAPHELIGTPIPGSTTLSPTWRNFLRLHDMPWLADHQLDSKIVLPGAGYVAMAIEAVRTIVDVSEQTISGYNLRDIDIVSVLTIPEGAAGVETQLCLRQCSEKELDHENWYSFELSSLGPGDSWIRHCTGYVSASLSAVTEASPEWVKESTKSLEQPYRSSDFFGVGGRSQSLQVGDIFAGLREMTFYHGPMFQNLVDSNICGTKGITTLNIAPCTSETDREYALHPTTLDSIIVAAYSTLSSTMRNGTMAVPRAIETLYIPRAFPRHSADQLRAFTELTKQNRRGMTSDVVVVSSDEDQSNALRMKGFFMQSVPQGQSAGDIKREPIMCFKTRWEPDTHDALDSTATREALKVWLNPEEVNFEKKIARATYYLVADAIQELGDVDTTTLNSDQAEILNWMRSVMSQVENGELAPGCRAWPKTSKGLKQTLLDEISTTNAAGKLTLRVGRQLARIVRGETSSLDIAKQDNLLQSYFEELPRQVRSYTQLAEILRLYAVQQPDAKILEIGAEIGYATKPILKALSSADFMSGLLCASYELTQPTEEALEAAKRGLQAYGNSVEYRTLRLDAEPKTQGFATSEYDLVLVPYSAPQREHLCSFLTHVKSLLRPGGQLIWIENSRLSVDLQLVLGTFPGRLPGNDALVSSTQWNAALKDAGFTGLEFEFNDCEDSNYQSSRIIMSTATKQPALPGEISLVYAGSKPLDSWVDSLRREVRDATGAILSSAQHLDDATVKEDAVCIFVAEMEQPLLDTIDSATFERLRKLLLRSSGLLWLSCGSLAASGIPKFGMTQGFLRTIREEDTSKRVVHLDFEQGTDELWSDSKRGYILRVLKDSFDEHVDLASTEREYAVKDSILHVLRVYPDEAEENATATNPADPEPEMLPWNQPGRNWVYEVDPNGLLSNTHFVDNPAIAEQVPSGYVEIEPKSFGLNFRDVLTSLGQLDETLIGNECSGIVTRLGPGADTATTGLKVGDRVCAIAENRFGSKVFSRWSSAALIPDAMSFEEASTIPYIWSTAYHGLIDLARIEKGESILIHSATGGVGQATLMLARHIGAEVFVTCSSQAKRDFLISTYGLAPDHIFSSRDKSFVSGVKAMTGGRGVDVVMNHLAGPLLKATWDCMAPFGRFLEIGKVDMEAARRLDMTPFTRCASIYGIDILQLGKYKGRQLRRALDGVIRLWEQRAVGVVGPITTYSISDMEKAMRAMQGGTHMGKIVLIPGGDDLVKVVSRRQPLRFLGARATDATYLVVGGLGGIGRTIAIWLAERGARHVLLVSRNAETHADAPQLHQQASDLGCDLQIRNCDITDESSLDALLKNCSGTMPPVKGVIHAAMLLQDTVLDRMTYEQWCRGVSPKVAGAWNIHKCVKNLDFFVMLSSVVGVSGHMSQANYAAGNAFLDALARYRAARGLPAVSLDLGGVKSVGFVAESTDNVLDRVIKLGSIPIEIKRVLLLIESGIRNPLRRNVDDAQVVTCIDSWTNVESSSPIKRDRRFRALQAVARAAGSDSNKAQAQASGDMLLTQVLTAATVTLVQATEAITAAITNKIAKIFNLDAAEIDGTLSMSHYGVDSLVAVELRNWLSSSIKAKLSLFDILQSTSLTTFGTVVASKSEFLTGLAQ